MGYATQTEIETAAGGAERFVQLADWDRDGVVDPAVLARAIAESDGWIDSHLRLFNAADLERLRSTPTETIKRIAAAEVVFWYREKRQAITPEELELRKMRTAELVDMRADKLRPDDQKAARGRFVENDGDVSRDKTKGMW